VLISTTAPVCLATVLSRSGSTPPWFYPGSGIS
jgi:hypothetical protein